MEAITLHVPTTVTLTDEQFYQLCKPLAEIYRPDREVETLNFSTQPISPYLLWS